MNETTISEGGKQSLPCESKLVEKHVQSHQQAVLYAMGLICIFTSPLRSYNKTK